MAREQSHAGLACLAATALLAASGCAMDDGYNLAVGSDSVPTVGESPDASVPAFVLSVLPTAPVVCAGACAALSAQASGGEMPYAYRWDDRLASDGGAVTVCPKSTTTYAVTATDTSAHATGEIPVANQTASARVTVMVSDCADASIHPEGGVCSSGAQLPDAGHYAGTLSCNSQFNGGIAFSPFTVDLTVDATTLRQTGRFWGLWSANGIVIAGTLDGNLDCSMGALTADIADGVWGTSGPNMTVNATTMLVGAATIRTTGAGTIGGTLDYTVGQIATCAGTFTATLQP